MEAALAEDAEESADQAQSAVAHFSAPGWAPYPKDTFVLKKVSILNSVSVLVFDPVVKSVRKKTQCTRSVFKLAMRNIRMRHFLKTQQVSAYFTQAEIDILTHTPAENVLA